MWIRRQEFTDLYFQYECDFDCYDGETFQIKTGVRRRVMLLIFPILPSGQWWKSDITLLFPLGGITYYGVPGA